MTTVVALVDDLFFQAKMTETARQVGVDLKTVLTGDALVAAAQQGSAALLIVDLNARAGVDALEQLRAGGNQLPVIAFLSHVQTELAERARRAGCQQVLPRSKFVQNLAALFTQAKKGK